MSAKNIIATEKFVGLVTEEYPGVRIMPESLSERLPEVDVELTSEASA